MTINKPQTYNKNETIVDFDDVYLQLNVSMVISKGWDVKADVIQ